MSKLGLDRVLTTAITVRRIIAFRGHLPSEIIVSLASFLAAIPDMHFLQVTHKLSYSPQFRFTSTVPGTARRLRCSGDGRVW
jgi:hypothetical protein